MQWSTGACLCAVLLLQLQGSVVNASFWDTIPLFSQGKSLVQLIGGDPEAAKQTQKNFINQMPVVSQVKSAVELATGNSEAALETQKHFLNNAETMVDGTPGVGHIKGSIHMLAGDEEHGLNIIRGATWNTGTAMGILGGPVGAGVGGLVTDMIIPNIDTASAAVTRNIMFIKPDIKVKYPMNIHKRSVGEHIDAMATVALQEAAGGRVSNSGKATKPQYETLQKRVVKTNARKELVDYLNRLQAEKVKEMNDIQLATLRQLVESYEREKSNRANYD